jgi:hypothetical protein
LQRFFPFPERLSAFLTQTTQTEKLNVESLPFNVDQPIAVKESYMAEPGGRVHYSEPGPAAKASDDG